MDILLVEYDSLLAECLSEEIVNFGDNVIGPFADAKESLCHVGDAHGAVLDLMLSDGPSYPVADALVKINRPFVFLTGYDRRELPKRFHRTAIFKKPSRAKPMLRELHSRHSEHMPDPVEIHDILLDMMAYARLKMPDRISADRLVAAVMEAAIFQVEQGKLITDLRAMLISLLEREIKATRPN